MESPINAWMVVISNAYDAPIVKFYNPDLLSNELKEVLCYCKLHGKDIHAVYEMMDWKDWKEISNHALINVDNVPIILTNQICLGL